MSEKGKAKFFYGYVVVAAATVIFFTVWGGNRTFGIFLEPMLNEFGWTRAGISGAYTFTMLIMGVLGVFAGTLTDRFGPRVVLLGSACIMGLAFILISRVQALWQFYLFYGVILGVGMSGTFIPLMSAVVRWFVKRRALMSSMLTAGQAVGIVVLPPLFTLLISNYGWRVSYVILGGVTLAVIFLAGLAVKRDPGEMGMMPYGADESTTRHLDLQAAGLSLGEAVRTRQFWLLSTLSFADFFIINGIVVHIVIHAIGLGMAPTAAAGILSLAAGISIPARIIVGGIADKIGYRRALTICFSVAAAGLLLLQIEDPWILYVFAPLFGFSLWASHSLIPPLMAELFGLRSNATILAASVFIGSIGGALGPVVAGYIYDVTGGYALAFLVFVAAAIIAVVSVLSLRPLLRDTG